MKIKKNEVLFLIAFLGILAAVLVYTQVYMPTLEKTEALEAENATHASYIAQLEAWESQLDTFQQESARMVKEVNDIFGRFPAESRAEDAIMYAVELEAQDMNTYISSVGLTEPAVAYTAAPTTVKLNEHMEDGERVYQLYNQQISFTQEFNYDGMKRFVNSIVNENERRNIGTITMAFDSATGQLHGTTSMNLFTLQGTDKVYQKTVIPSMQMGVSNIFGTFEIETEEIEAEQPAEE